MHRSDSEMQSTSSDALTSQLSTWCGLAISTSRALRRETSPVHGRMEQHTTLKADHQNLTCAYQQTAIELQEVTKQRDCWKQECDRQTEMLVVRQENLQNCTTLLMMMRSVEDTVTEPAEPEPAAAQVRLGPPHSEPRTPPHSDSAREVS